MADDYNIYGPLGVWARSKGLTSDDLLAGCVAGGGGGKGGHGHGPGGWAGPGNRRWRGYPYGDGYYDVVYPWPYYVITSDDILEGFLGNLDILGAGESAFEIPGKPIQFKNGKLFPWKDGFGWNRARGNAVDLFTKARGRTPTADERATLARIVAHIRSAQKRGTGDPGAESDFEGGWARLSYYVQNGREARGPALDEVTAHARNVVQAHINAYEASRPKGWLGTFVQDIGSAVHSVTHAAASLYDSATGLVGKLPFIGEPLHSALGLISGPMLMVDAIANGDNVIRTATSSLKDTLANASNVAQYATAITSAVPGLGAIGAGVDGALAAASAISQGKPITGALIDAVKNSALKALPGGPLIQKAAAEAFEVGKAIANGDRLDKIALDRTRAQLPPAAQKAFDTGLAIAQGQKLQDIVVSNVSKLAPKVLGNLGDEGIKVLAVSPVLRRAAVTLSGQPLEGFRVASAFLARKGVPEKAVAALRNRLPSSQRAGFDKAVQTHAQHFQAFRQV